MFYKQTAPELNTKKRKYQMAPRPCLFTTFLFYANHWMQILRHANWKSTDNWSLTCFESILKILHSKFAVIYLCNLLFSLKVSCFITVSIAFSVYKQNFTAQKVEQLGMLEFSVFVICVETIICLLS